MVSKKFNWLKTYDQSWEGANDCLTGNDSNKGEVYIIIQVWNLTDTWATHYWSNWKT